MESSFLRRNGYRSSPAPRRPPHRAGAGGGGLVHRRQLRADRQQPPFATTGILAAPLAQDQQGEALRRRPARPARVPRHGRRVRGGHRQRARPGDGQPRRGAGVDPAARGAAPPRRRAHHLHHRRQRGVQGQRHRPAGQPPARHALRAPRARRAGPARARERHHRALAGHHVRLLPALRRRVPPVRRVAPAAVPRLPVGDEGPVPHQLLPVLRLQGRPGAGAAGVRALPAQRRRHRPPHRAQLRQHALRAGGRRVRGHPGHGAHRRPRQGLRDGVAVPGRPGRVRGHAGARRDVHREPPQEDRDEAGHAAAPGGAHRRLRLRALQREPQARPGVGAQLRPLLPRRHTRLQRRPARLPAAVNGGFTRNTAGDSSACTYRHGVGRFRLVLTASISNQLPTYRDLPELSRLPSPWKLERIHYDYFPGSLNRRILAILSSAIWMYSDGLGDLEGASYSDQFGSLTEAMTSLTSSITIILSLEEKQSHEHELFMDRW